MNHIEILIKLHEELIKDGEVVEQDDLDLQEIDSLCIEWLRLTLEDNGEDGRSGLELLELVESKLY